MCTRKIPIAHRKITKDPINIENLVEDCHSFNILLAILLDDYDLAIFIQTVELGLIEEFSFEYLKATFPYWDENKISKTYLKYCNYIGEHEAYLDYTRELYNAQRL